MPAIKPLYTAIQRSLLTTKLGASTRDSRRLNLSLWGRRRPLGRTREAPGGGRCPGVPLGGTPSPLRVLLAQHRLRPLRRDLCGPSFTTEQRPRPTLMLTDVYLRPLLALLEALLGGLEGRLEEFDLTLLRLVLLHANRRKGSLEVGARRRSSNTRPQYV